MPLETTITNSILKYLNSIESCVAEKVMGNAMQKDRPDINGCYRGLSFRIEVKSPDHGNQPSKGQLLDIKKWVKAGCVAFVAYSLTDVKIRIDGEKCV